MPQMQNKTSVVALDGHQWEGVATGNNAAWHCVCGYKTPLLGRTGALSGATEKTRIECPTCRRNYFVMPTGKNRGSVREVREIKWSQQL